MTERDIQHALYDLRRSIQPFPLMVPNVYLWWWECDLVYVSRSDYATEFEIKLTHSDFLADKKKLTKHDCLANELEDRGPAEFFYVCPRGVIVVDELPPYAGLIYVDKQKRSLRSEYWLSDCVCDIMRRKRRRSAKPLDDGQIIGLLEKGLHRYWSIQQHIKNRGGHSEAVTPPPGVRS